MSARGGLGSFRCLALGYRVGPGTDGGRDLIVEELGDELFGGHSWKWLVSCKHFAHANAGASRAVSRR